jgi:Tol biopolymer transport system component
MRSTSFVSVLLLIAFAGGCATNRTITISTRPDDALLRIDGVDRGRGPITEQFSFHDETETHRVSASRLGFKDEIKEITRDYTSATLEMEMKPQTRKINISIFPVPANVSIDGLPISTDPVSTLSRELPFTVDSKGSWIGHTITCERFGFQPKVVQVAWTDRDPDYVINLDRLKKDLSITTTPVGANIYLDGQFLGTTSSAGPLRDLGREFYVDPDSNQWLPRKLRATSPGYDPVEKTISWDNGATDYHLDLTPKTKSIRIITDPPNAVVMMDGKALPHDASGASVAQNLQFPPDDKGQLKTFSCVAAKKTDDSEWEPAAFTIAWDDGKTDYPVVLKEILTRPVPLLEPVWSHGDNGWEISPHERTTLGMKSVKEPESGHPAQLIARPGKGISIDSLDVSPDGTQVLFTVISGKTRSDFRGRMEMVHADGSGGVEYVSDGESLDLTPCFSPGGDQIAFASDRFGRRLSICSMATNGALGVRKITSGDNNDLWPSIDSEPSPHLFYESRVDTRSEPRIYSAQIGTTVLSDLTQSGGLQPRISPSNDALIYCGVNDNSGKREIFRLSLTDKAALPENLTNSPNDDCYDAAWSKDGSKIAYVVEHAGSDEKASITAGNPSIWILDMKSPGKPQQVTANESVNDRPVWDSTGNFIYFRSNRGGQWGIWKIPVR